MTRGIRNNNPLNIRKSTSLWKGKISQQVNESTSQQVDDEFEQFISMYYGFRAAILTIETYILEHNCNTIRKIITRWAPPRENNTERYINYVCSATDIGGNEVLSNHDKRLKLIIAAMAVMESGKGIYAFLDSLDRAWDDYKPREIYVHERRNDIKKADLAIQET